MGSNVENGKLRLYGIAINWYKMDNIFGQSFPFSVDPPLIRDNKENYHLHELDNSNISLKKMLTNSHFMNNISCHLTSIQMRCKKAVAGTI